MTDFTVEIEIPVKPQVVYDAWLDGALHEKMTGGAATGKPVQGSEFTAWDGYISGKNLTLEPSRRIVQSWRTTEFGEDDPDSELEVLITSCPRGCIVTLNHRNIPEGQPDYAKGWEDHYFKPMQDYWGVGTC